MLRWPRFVSRVGLRLAKYCSQMLFGRQTVEGAFWSDAMNNNQRPKMQEKHNWELHETWANPVNSTENDRDVTSRLLFSNCCSTKEYWIPCWIVLDSTTLYGSVREKCPMFVELLTPCNEKNNRNLAAVNLNLWFRWVFAESKTYFSIITKSVEMKISKLSVLKMFRCVSQILRYVSQYR